MLASEYALGKRLFSVIIQDRHGFLQNDRAGIDSIINEVYRAARDLHTMFKRLPLGMQSRERRKQRRVNIENAPLEKPYEVRTQDPHVACQADQIDSMILQNSPDCMIKFRP